MQKKNIPSFFCGALFMLMLVGLILPASAASSEERIVSVFTDVKVYVDDAPIDGGDLNGNPEAFIYNGTTYIPARAVSNSLGKSVLWDGSTRSVYIGKHKGTVTNLMAVCKPYMTKGYDEPAVFSMGGNSYYDGFTLDHTGFAIFNLNGEYQSLEMDVGFSSKTFNSDNCDTLVHIYLDGVLVKTVAVEAESLPKHITVPLNSALQLKIERAIPEGVLGNTSKYGFANLTVD